MFAALSMQIFRLFHPQFSPKNIHYLTDCLPKPNYQPQRQKKHNDK